MDPVEVKGEKPKEKLSDADESVVAAIVDAETKDEKARTTKGLTSNKLGVMKHIVDVKNEKQDGYSVNRKAEMLKAVDAHIEEPVIDGNDAAEAHVNVGETTATALGRQQERSNESRNMREFWKNVRKWLTKFFGINFGNSRDDERESADAPDGKFERKKDDGRKEESISGDAAIAFGGDGQVTVRTDDPKPNPAQRSREAEPLADPVRA